MEAIRVFLVDDHEIVRHGLRSFLETAPDVRVVGETGDSRRAVSGIDALARTDDRVDVVLTDLMMPVLTGLDLVQRIRAIGNPPRVVILSAYGDAERVRRALHLDASGYVLKSTRPDGILDAVRVAADGGLYVDPALTAQLAHAATPASRDAPTLTRRERDVITLVAQGKSNVDIASELFISERTARTHVSHVLGKLGFGSRVQLALWAAETRD